MATVGEALRAIASGLPLADRVTDRVVEIASIHHELMVRWNKVHNLTRVLGAEDTALRHWADCLLAGLAVERVQGTPDRVVDVGSGAGFPGICLAALWREAEVTLLEPSRKRCSFLRQVRADAGLNNMTVLEGRVEEANATWPTVVSRATFPQAAVVKLASVCAADGWLFGLVGEAVSALEWQATADAAGVVEAVVVPYEVPGLDHRALLAGRKAKAG